MSTLGYRDLLKQNHDFRALWTGQIVSELGDWFNNIAVLALAMHLTGSGLVVTAVLLARTVPVVIFGPLAGVITDRFSRRSVLLGADYSRAVLALGFLLVTARERMWMAYLFTALRHAAAKIAARRPPIRRAPLSESEAVAAPQARALDAESAARLEGALAMLPAIFREAIALKIDGGLTFREMAAVLGVSPNTAASRYRYALAELRDALRGCTDE